MSIKKYTLSEIGIFYRTIILLEKESKIESLIHNWMSTHYEHKHIIETIEEMNKKSNLVKKEKDLSSKEIKSEWERLAGFMKQRK